MRDTMTPESLRKKQIEFVAIGVVGIIAVGILAALDAGNDLGEVLIGLVQFLAIIGVGVVAYFNRHRFLRPAHPTAAPDTPRAVAPVMSHEPESRLVLVAPGRHQMLTFDETLQTLEATVQELADARKAQSQLNDVTHELKLVQARLQVKDAATKHDIADAVASAQRQWNLDRIAIEQRHTAALHRVEQERDTALSTANRTTLPSLLDFINAALDGKLNRDITNSVAKFSNKDYGPFAQSVREAVALRFAPPSPVLSPLVVPGEITVKNGTNGHHTAGEGTNSLGRTEVEASDGPSDGGSDGASFPIVLYDAEFARIVAGAPPEVIT